ncbi:MAG: hypothetical protein K5694_05455 [Bacilli bacterium]|nr:hypothetical protein [Bacilli bacterium]
MTERKAKLIYSGELLAFSILFIVLGILVAAGVIYPSQRWRWIFSIVTLVGATWIFTDFFWTLFSEKKRAKSSMIDKILPLPAAAYLLFFDIFSLANGIPNAGDDAVELINFFRFSAAGVFFYIAIIYAFEAIYHYKHPIPGLLEEDDKKEETPTENKPEIEQKPETESKPIEEPIETPKEEVEEAKE